MQVIQIVPSSNKNRVRATISNGQYKTNAVHIHIHGDESFPNVNNLIKVEEFEMKLKKNIVTNEQFDYIDIMQYKVVCQSIDHCIGSPELLKRHQEVAGRTNKPMSTTSTDVLQNISKYVENAPLKSRVTHDASQTMMETVAEDINFKLRKLDLELEEADKEGL